MSNAAGAPEGGDCVSTMYGSVFYLSVGRTSSSDNYTFLSHGHHLTLSDLKPLKFKWGLRVHPDVVAILT